MAIRNSFLSAGVYTREFDLSFIQDQPPAIGLAVIGPTVRGPALVPTPVSSYREYVRWFGDAFLSGSAGQEQEYKYLTSYSVQEYLRYGEVAIVTRILGDRYAPALSFIKSIDGNFTWNVSGSDVCYRENHVAAGIAAYNAENSTAITMNNYLTKVNAATNDDAITDAQFTGINALIDLEYQNGISDLFAEARGTLTGFTGSASFELTLLSDGETGNSGIPQDALNGFAQEYVPGVDFDNGDTTDAGTYIGDGSILYGNRYNIRWEVVNLDPKRGTFDLLIRRGDDTDSRKIILESFNSITLDPSQSNYIEKVIGNQYYQLRADSSGVLYLQKVGTYPNRSRYIRAKALKKTMNYLTNDGFVRDYNQSQLLPDAATIVFVGLLNATGAAALGGEVGDVANSSNLTYFSQVNGISEYTAKTLQGTFAFGSDGNVANPRSMFDNIWESNTQGLNLSKDDFGKSGYLDALDMLSNKDEFNFDLLVTPGLIDLLPDHAEIITQAIYMVEDRGDAFYVVDPTPYGSSVGDAQRAAEARNSNYAGVYYPWVQIPDADLGENVWVPPSAVLPGVFAFNDYFGEKWNAPAGLMRGGLDTVIQTERVMTANDRDNLYIKNVNPIATFPKSGIVVWGQKTLQKKKSALDRINVRRLLIAAKRHVADTSKYLVFEQNTEETRAKFLNITRPWFENARKKQGLYDFRIIIDNSNNTADVIDRNEMRASIYLKPAKTAEFIIVDFMVLPTGAIFPVEESKEK